MGAEQEAQLLAEEGTKIWGEGVPPELQCLAQASGMEVGDVEGSRHICSGAGHEPLCGVWLGWAGFMFTSLAPLHFLLL